MPMDEGSTVNRWWSLRICTASSQRVTSHARWPVPCLEGEKGTGTTAPIERSCANSGNGFAENAPLRKPQEVVSPVGSPPVGFIISRVSLSLQQLLSFVALME